MLLFQILDEVEKRRGISPALVQPLMRSVMEAPFPALGRTITVKNFLPGSGTEVKTPPWREGDLGQQMVQDWQLEVGTVTEHWGSPRTDCLATVWESLGNKTGDRRGWHGDIQWPQKQKGNHMVKRSVRI